MASQVIVDDRRGASVGGVSVGRVFQRSVNIITANPVATLGVTFVLLALPQLVFGQLGGQASLGQEMNAGAYALVGGYGLVVAVLWLVGSGALVQAALAHDQGRAADWREMLQTGVRRAVPLFAVNLLFLVAAWIGSIFLIVPGIMLVVMWSVSLPAIVAERPGVFGAFGRSRALTKGARWHVFGIVLIACVLYMLASVAIGVVGVAGHGTLGALTGSAQVRMPPTPSLILQLVQSGVTTIMLTWFTLVGASLFIELRHWKDGPDIDRLSEIFA